MVLVGGRAGEIHNIGGGMQKPTNRSQFCAAAGRYGQGLVVCVDWPPTALPRPALCSVDIGKIQAESSANHKLLEQGLVDVAVVHRGRL
jgi:hypothetical protein